MYHKISHIILCFCLSSVICIADLHDYSGAVQIENNNFLVVHDKKHPRDKGQPRAGLLTLHADKGGVKYTPVAINWPKGESPSSDLEACCRVAGTSDQYLLAESGYYKGNYGRIFHVKLDVKGAKAQVLGVLRLFPAPQDGMTGKAKQIEGITTITDSQGKLIAILGKRGRGKKSGRLVWGYLNLPQKSFQEIGSQKLDHDILKNYARGCSDLHLVAQQDNWVVWSVATVDAGDNGPFRSLVYRVGNFSFQEGQLKFTSDVQSLWKLEGLKVEGLASPAPISSACKATVVTDDEFYGGVCRLLFAPAK